MVASQANKLAEAEEKCKERHQCSDSDEEMVDLPLKVPMPQRLNMSGIEEKSEMIDKGESSAEQTRVPSMLLLAQNNDTSIFNNPNINLAAAVQSTSFKKSSTLK